MSFENGFNDQRRVQSDPAASRVASEIFSHQLQGASQETRRAMQGRSSQDAELFVRHVNSDLQRMAQQYGQRPENYLSTRQFAQQNGQQGEYITLTNGYQSKNIAAVSNYGGDTFGNPTNYSDPNRFAGDPLRNSLDPSRLNGVPNRFGDPRYDQSQSGDAVARVANEIYSHRLQEAAQDTRNYMQGRSGPDAQNFANSVNHYLARIASENGQDQEHLANYLSVRQVVGRDGQQKELLSLTDGYHSKGIAAVSMYPYNRVGMNFDQSQNGQFGQNGDYSQAQSYYGNPNMQVADGGYQGFGPPPYSSGFGYRGYPPRYGYGNQNVAAYAIGSLIGRALHIRV